MNSSIEWPVRVYFYKYEDLPMTSGSRRKVWTISSFFTSNDSYLWAAKHIDIVQFNLNSNVCKVKNCELLQKLFSNLSQMFSKIS